MLGARTGRRRAGSPRTFIPIRHSRGPGIHPLCPCQSARSPVHPAAWLFASHAPPACCCTARGALFSRCVPEACRARWTARCRLRLTRSFGRSNSSELCVVPLSFRSRVLVTELFCVRVGGTFIAVCGAFLLVLPGPWADAAVFSGPCAAIRPCTARRLLARQCRCPLSGPKRVKGSGPLCCP